MVTGGHCPEADSFRLFIKDAILDSLCLHTVQDINDDGDMQVNIWHTYQRSLCMKFCLRLIYTNYDE